MKDFDVTWPENHKPTKQGAVYLANAFSEIRNEIYYF